MCISSILVAVAFQADTIHIALFGLLLLGVFFILAGCLLGLWTLRNQRKDRVLHYSSTSLSKDE
ncbi:MAG TPA: hypothetical protein VFN23_06365 [Ktedonobacteraceae bacterium]|nr:hypothetical protein [Ktedonobacteraceae bacterium]